MSLTEESLQIVISDKMSAPIPKTPHTPRITLRGSQGSEKERKKKTLGGKEVYAVT